LTISNYSEITELGDKTDDFQLWLIDAWGAAIGKKRNLVELAISDQYLKEQTCALRKRIFAKILAVQVGPWDG
jgi:hypothetical protein